jgi:hypothetical protein
MPDYPRELTLSADETLRLTSYLDTELRNHDMERTGFVDDLVRAQKDYWAKPPVEKVTFPFSGAATLIIPLTAIAVEAVHSRTMTRLFGLPQFVSAKAKGDAYGDIVRPIEQFMDHELLHSMKLRDVIENPILEIEKFGIGIGKSGYEKINKTAVRTAPDGSEEEFTVPIKNGACIDGVQANRFIMPYYSVDPQTAPWVGEYHTKTPFEVLGMENSGFFKKGTFKTLEDWVSRTIDGQDGERRYEREMQKMENRQAVWPKQLDWAEVWLEWDVDGSGFPKEIVVHYHRASNTIMSMRYNWHSDLHRPYRYGNYFKLEYRWHGIGICKQNEAFQKEITTLHRQRLDNGTLANVRMLKVKRLSGYGPKEPIFPGKIWFVEDKDDIDVMQMGEIYPSGYNNETSTLVYSQQRTGVNEVTLGMPQVGTPGTATGDTMRIQEGNQKFDYVFTNIKRFVNELVVDSLCNIQQFGPKNLSYFTEAAGGPLVQQFLTLPPEHIRDCILIEIGAVGQQQNKVTDRQNWLNITQVIQQYYMALSQIAMNSGDPMLTQLVMQKAPIAATEAFVQFLQTFDIRNIDRIALTELINNGLNPMAQPPGATGTPQLLPPSGMASGA